MITQFDEAYVRHEDYYRTSGLNDVYSSCTNIIKKETKNKKVALTADLYGNPSLGISLLAITCLYFNDEFERQNRVLVAKAVKGKHTAEFISNLFTEAYKIMDVEDANVVYLTRDNGSNIKAAAEKLSVKSTQCVEHCYHLSVCECIKAVADVAKTVENVRKLCSSFSRSTARKEKLEKAQTSNGLPTSKLPRIIPVRWNSTFNALNAVAKNEAALLSMVREGEQIYISPADFPVIQELVKILELIAARSTHLGREDATVSEIIPDMKIIIAWIKKIKDEEISKMVVKEFADCLMKSIEKRSQQYYSDYIYGAMAVDPRFSNDLAFLTKSQWKIANEIVITLVCSSTKNSEIDNDEEAAIDEAEESNDDNESRHDGDETEHEADVETRGKHLNNFFMFIIL